MWALASDIRVDHDSLVYQKTATVDPQARAFHVRILDSLVRQHNLVKNTLSILKSNHSQDLIGKKQLFDMVEGTQSKSRQRNKD